MYSKKEKQALVKDAAKFILPHFASNELIAKEPKVFVKGEGCYLFDIDGKKYLDTFASLLTTICGHHQPEVDEAIRKQLEQLEFFPNYVDTFTPPLIELSRKLAEILPGDLSVSFYVNSGSEANETAIKAARQYHLEKGHPEKVKIFFRRFSYHGTTLGGSSATGLPWFREYFEPLLPGFIPTFSARCYDCELGLKPKTCGLKCLDLVEQQIAWEGARSIAGMIMDPIPGSNIGFPLPPSGYIERVREICDKNNMLLIFDEVQTGFGKTGKLFACEHWNVVPDIITLGKGFTGGYIPLAATVLRKPIARVFQKKGSELRSGSTYGGHTVGCAATLANINVILKNDLTGKAEKQGKYLVKGLESLKKKHSIVGDISGIGLLRAMFLKRDPSKGVNFTTEENVGGFIRSYCYEHGIILRNNGDILVFAPALIITKDQIDEVITVLNNALKAAEERFLK